jgi:plastocyanin
MRTGARKTLLAMAAFVAGLALAVAPTLGANKDVISGPNDNDIFSPANVTISQGDSVTWKNDIGNHNVRFDDGSYRMPSSPQTNAWTVSRTFTTPGSFRYYCDQHGGPNGDGMSGRVVVNAAGTTTTPGGGEGGGGGGSGGGGGGGTTLPTLPVIPGDAIAPKLTLGGSAGQRVLKAGALLIDVTADEKSIVTVSAKITLAGGKVLKLKKVTRVVEAGKRAKLKLRLSRKAKAAIAAALRKRSRLKAKVSVIVRDGNGNTRSSSRTVKIKR